MVFLELVKAQPQVEDLPLLALTSALTSTSTFP